MVLLYYNVEDLQKPESVNGPHCNEVEPFTKRICLCLERPIIVSLLVGRAQCSRGQVLTIRQQNKDTSTNGRVYIAQKFSMLSLPKYLG